MLSHNILSIDCQWNCLLAVILVMTPLPSYPRFELGRVLSTEQRAFFTQHGFLHFRSFSAPEHVQQLLQATEHVQARWLAENVKKVNGVSIKYGRDVDGVCIVLRFAFASQHQSVLHALLQDARLQA